MRTINENRLMAYADRWLDPPEAQQVEQAVASSRSARDFLVGIQWLSDEIRRAFEPAMSEAPPQRLVAVIDDNTRNVRAFFRRLLAETVERQRCNWKAQ
jgi:anti-sigma factor RsiW